MFTNHNELKICQETYMLWGFPKIVNQKKACGSQKQAVNFYTSNYRQGYLQKIFLDVQQTLLQPFNCPTLLQLQKLTLITRSSPFLSIENLFIKYLEFSADSNNWYFLKFSNENIKNKSIFTGHNPHHLYNETHLNNCVVIFFMDALICFNEVLQQLSTM